MAGTIEERTFDLVDTAEAVGPFSYLDAGGEQDVYTNEVTTRRKISFEMSLKNMTQNGTVRVYRKVDGATYDIWIERTYTAAGAEKVWTVEDVITNQHFKVTYQEAVDEGAARSIPYNVIIQVQEN